VDLQAQSVQSSGAHAVRITSSPAQTAHRWESAHAADADALVLQERTVQKKRRTSAREREESRVEVVEEER
jgi:hypothetical protein